MQPTPATERQIQKFWTDQPMIHPGYGFDRHAASPEEVFAHVETLMRDKGSLMQKPGAPLLSGYIDFLSLRSKEILEIGFGVGWLLNEFVQAGARVHGIDLSESHYRFSSYRFRDRPDVDLRLGSAQDIPHPNDTFDFVAAYGVLHHAEDDQRCYDEVYRVLKPGGRAFLMLYRRGGPKYWWWKMLRRGVLGGGLARHGFNREAFINSVTDAYEGDGAPISRHYSRRDLDRLFRRFRTMQASISGNRNEWDCLPAHRLPLTNWLLPRAWREALVRWSGAYWMVTLQK